MPFKVSPAVQLKVSSGLVLAILSSIHRRNAVWTDASLKVEMRRIGIAFTDTEVTDITTALLASGDLVNFP